jgi:hypothetical protein
VFYYGSVAEAIAYLNVSDDALADYAGRVYEAAAGRGEDGPDGTT